MGCGVVELRRYALHPGARETLIELFEREFVETQEAVGIRVLGTFRDADDPDSFVWLRGFDDMSARAPALRSFYGGPVWAGHRDTANATMIDVDDVSLFATDGARDEHDAKIDLRVLLAGHLAGELETHRLQPTSRSLLPD